MKYIVHNDAGQLVPPLLEATAEEVRNMLEFLPQGWTVESYRPEPRDTSQDLADDDPFNEPPWVRRIPDSIARLNDYGVNRKTCIHVGVFAKPAEHYTGVENPTEWCPRCSQNVPISEL